MKTTKSSSASRRGFTLWIYVSILMIGAIGLAGVLSYSMTSSLRTARNNEYIATTYVAESLAEKVRGQIQWDNKNWQQTFVSGRITSDYLPTLLTSTDNSYFSNYGISVVNITNWHATAVPLDPPYTGWTNEGYKYQVIVLASNKVSPYHVPVRVGIEINLVSLSIFHNAAFWGGGMDLEINPGKDMIIGGTVYTGGNLWMQPNGVTLTFSNDIAAVGTIQKTKSPLDPTASRSAGTITNMGSAKLSLSNQVLLTMPVGTNVSSNNPAAVHAVLEVPSSSEDPFGTVGTNRMYNKADISVVITNGGFIVSSGRYHANPQVISDFPTNAILRTNEFLYDWREGYSMRLTTVDVGALRAYAMTNTTLLALNGYSGVNTFFVADARSTNGYSITNITTNIVSTALSSPWVYISSNKATNVVSGTNKVVTNLVYVWTNKVTSSKPAILLTNAQMVPIGGLTFATPDPVYFLGDFNTSTNGTNFSVATADTSYTYASAVMADAITVLSSNFDLGLSYNTNLGNRSAAVNTTINTAILAGNHPSDGTYYSGGFENYPRFMQDWSSSTFYYNGSMVCMFPSQIANQPMPNVSTSLYSVPTRRWTYDNKLSTSAPSNAPNITVSSKGRWAILTNGAMSF